MASRPSISILALVTVSACFNPDGGGNDEAGSTGPEPGTSTGPVAETTDDADSTDGMSTSSATMTAETTVAETTADETTVAETTVAETTSGDPVCGDGVVEGDEDCDDRGESATCDDDCSVVECGDSLINATAGEQCDDGADNGLTRRCSEVCIIGAGLDGTFGAVWEELPVFISNGSMFGLQSMHYSGQAFIHDLSQNFRFNLVLETWSPIPTKLPYTNQNWANAATDADFHWVPREGSMWQFEIATNAWVEFEMGLPDGNTDLTAAVFDGEGNIWYHAENGLVRYDPTSGSVLQLPHPDFGNMFETRIGYDPITNSIIFTGFINNQLVIYSIDDDTFTQLPPTPGGNLRDNSCQDRSGNFYIGSNDEPTLMYQYNLETDTYTTLPPLPFSHDNNSSCVVSQDGFLYVGNGSPIMARLPLGTL